MNDLARDDELARLGVLQELTVAATQLFAPSAPIRTFLDRLAVRLGAVVALCLEKNGGPTLLLGDVGLSEESRRLTLPPLTSAREEDWIQALPYPELRSSELSCWAFPLDLATRKQSRHLLLFFDSESQALPRYRVVVRRLCQTLSAALHHRDVLTQSIASERRIADQAAQLQAQNELILAANARLEQRVAERTRELTASNAELSASLATLHATQAQLLRSGKLAAVGTLVAGIAHELNNPLSYTVANLELLNEQLAQLSHALKEQDHRELVELSGFALQGAERICGIVAGLRKFSRMETQQHAPIDLRQLLQTVERMVRPEVSRRARFIVSLDEQLPLVMGDDLQLSQVFVNLIVNASQAIPPGNLDGNQIWVAALTDPEGHVLVEVNDTGAGIPEHVLPRIFDPFFTTKPVGEGTGLGLSICHGIVLEHGGELQVRSTVGVGTTFTVRLPPTTQPRKPITTSPRPPGQHRRGRVLVIDDEPSVGRALLRLLGSEHEVIVSQSAAASLGTLANGEKFDAILCDIMMPGMTGIDFYSAIQRQRPELVGRIIFVTGDTSAPSTSSFLEQISNATISKPFSARTIRETVRGCIERNETYEI